MLAFGPIKIPFWLTKMNKPLQVKLPRSSLEAPPKTLFSIELSTEGSRTITDSPLPILKELKLMIALSR